MSPRVLIVDDNAELLGLLATVFEDAGYEASTAQRGRPALEKIKVERPDVAVVDILLPDVIGYELANLLRQQRVPFVLMTGVFKGGRHALEAVSKHGAAACFEKPFEIDELVKKVVSLVQPAPKTGLRVAPEIVRRGPQDSQPPRRDSIDPEIELGDAIESEEGESREVVLTGRVSVTEADGHVSATLRGEDLRFQSTLPRRAPDPPSRPPPSRPPAPPSQPPVMSPVSQPTAPVVAQSASRIGLLKDNLPQLISAFYLARETGELVLQRGQVRKVVYFEKGAPVFAVSNLSTDRFGQFLVRTGKVQAEEFQAAAMVADRTSRRTGDVLIEMGLLTETERMYYVGQQVKAIIYSLFAWEDGNWLLSFKRRARTETLKLDLHPANLIMRGVKKLYSPARLDRILPDSAVPIPAQDPSYLLSDVELEGWEAMLLSRVDGTRPTSELLKIANRSSEQVRGLLVGLLSLKILNLAS